MKIPVVIIGLLAANLVLAPAFADDRSIIVQSTTSTANSGLYDHLLPAFQDATGITVKVVAVGTGQAIRNARNCDGDVLLVHAKQAEEAFVADGMGLERADLMYNDFILVGPSGDPAGINGMTDAQGALTRIADAGVLFASRGDDSGTHKKERQLWSSTAANPDAASGEWYRETGSGMGATLNAAIGMQAYTMTDRSTWISFGNKANFVVHVQGDPDLFNQYGVIVVNPDKCPNVDRAAAEAFAGWLLSAPGQKAIAAYRLHDQQLFFPNAAK